MLKRFGLDSLLLFLLLSVAFLWLAFPQIKTGLFQNDAYAITDLSVNEQVSFPEQGPLYYGDIKLHNPELKLMYSLDGGKSYREAPQEGLQITDIRNSPILYKNTSIRWRHPKGEFPSLYNVVLKVRDEKERAESKPKVLTYYHPTTSEYIIVNVTVNEADLFDWQQGIMIYGEESSHDQGFYKEWWYRSANFASRGSNWSRPANVQVFTRAMDLNWLEELNCDMKISGNATRYFPQKSLKFKTLDQYGKPAPVNSFFPPVNGKPKKSSSLLLRQGGNDNNRTMFADLLMHKLARESEVLTMHGFPVSVFLNGNYWGIYNCRERIDPLFIAEMEGVKEKDVTLLYCEVYGDRTLLKEGSKKEKQAFDSLIISLPEQIQDENEYQRIKDEISIKSFIDYIIFETFYANQDWLHNNTTWYKADQKKWKWVLNDLDLSLAYPGDENVNSNLFDKLLKRNSITSKLFSSLITYPEFKERFKKRAHEIIAYNFSDKNIESHYSSLKERYGLEIDRQIRRWRFIDSRAQWEKDCEKNVTFLRDRRTIYLKQVDNL